MGGLTHAEYHVVYLFKADIRGELLVDESMDLSYWDSAFLVKLYFLLDVLVADVLSVLDVQDVCVVHAHSGGPNKSLAVCPPLEPYSNRAAKLPTVS